MMPSSSLFLEIDLPMKPCLLWFHKKFEENGQNLTKKIQNGSNLPPCPPNLFARLCCVVAECYSSAPELIKVAIYNCIETLPHCTLGGDGRADLVSCFVLASNLGPLTLISLRPIGDPPKQAKVALASPWHLKYLIQIRFSKCKPPNKLWPGSLDAAYNQLQPDGH